MIVYDTWRGFDWVKKSRKKLVVTIGESWTWGDSLGKTQHRVYDDKECRLAHVYGGQLADMSQHMDVAKIRTNFLLDSKFNYKKASKHPTPEGHTFWAKYLYNSLNIN